MVAGNLPKRNPSASWLRNKPVRSTMMGSGACLAAIRLHPIKSLDAVSVTESRVGPGGGLELDRVWALYSADGECVNGKRTAAIHRIRAAFAPDLSTVTLSVPGDGARYPIKEFAFPGDAASAADWFSEYFDRRISVRYVPESVPDDALRNGPMIVSTATLQAVTDWFTEIVLQEMRRRFRTPLEIQGVPAFWEDRLFGAEEEKSVRFHIGEVSFDGINPCPRCPVSARDSQTGADTLGFQKRFSELRRQNLPSWTIVERFAHFYYLGLNTRIPATEIGKCLRVGDPVAFNDS